jgi:hypothetical protein
MTIKILFHLAMILLTTGISYLYREQFSIYYLSVLLFAIGIYSLGFALKDISIKRPWTLNQTYLFSQSLFWTLALLFCYPGFYTYDSFFTLINTQTHTADPWQTYLYGVLCHMLSLFNERLFFVPVFSVASYLFCQALILQSFPLKKKSQLFIFSCLSLNPLTLVTIPLVSRDTVFGALSCVVLFLFLRPSLSFVKKWSSHQVLAFLAVAVFTSQLRQDGAIYLLAIPVLLFLIRHKISKKVLIASSLLAVFLFGARVFSNLKEASPDYQKYQMTAMIHPLNYMLFSQKISLTDSQTEVIDQVVPLEHLVESYHPAIISQFHQELHHLPVSTELWRSFRWTYFDLVFSYPTVFLEERLSVLVNTLFFTEHTFVFCDMLNEAPEVVVSQLKRDLLFRPHFFQTMGKPFRDFLLKSHYLIRRSFVTSFLFLSPLFALMMAFLFALRHRPLLPFFNLCMFFLGLRGIFVFLTAPEPHLTYYAPLIYFPFLFIQLCIVFDPRIKN